MNSSIGESQQWQNVVVMRHGDRIDNFEPMWAVTAARNWDPPLAEAGKTRAFCTGKKLRETNLGFPIHRVFVSPFLRCLQTASEVISALCAVDDDPLVMTSEGVAIDPSKVKAAVEYGLSEMLNKEATRLDVAPNDGKFVFDISECNAKLLAGTVDHSVKRVFEELPKWEEPKGVAITRFMKVIKVLADEYPSENLLLVTHGKGVRVSVSAFLPDRPIVYKVEFCAFSQLKRPVYIDENNSVTAGEFEVLFSKGQTGISLSPGRAKEESIK